jgi:hypothetical protein
MSQAKTTTDHTVIRNWVEARGGRPARVKATGKGKDTGILRFDFGEPDEKLEEIDWDEFFDKFEKSELALLYQDQRDSRFNKLIRREEN